MRLDRLLQDNTHDPYFVKQRYRDPSVCERCRVLFRNGVFEWASTIPPNSAKMICPACRRIEDDFEGGVVTLEGEFLEQHKKEIMNIINNTEKSEQHSRPLERILSLKEDGGRVEIRTTYEHIARRIGESVRKAYKGELTVQYRDGEKYARVFWKRGAG